MVGVVRLAEWVRRQTLPSCSFVTFRRCVTVLFVACLSFTTANSDPQTALFVDGTSWLLTGFFLAILIVWAYRKSEEPPPKTQSRGWLASTTPIVLSAAFLLSSDICGKIVDDPLGMLWPNSLLVPAAILAKWAFIVTAPAELPLAVGKMATFIEPPGPSPGSVIAKFTLDWPMMGLATLSSAIVLCSAPVVPISPETFLGITGVVALSISLVLFARENILRLNSKSMTSESLLPAADPWLRYLPRTKALDAHHRNFSFVVAAVAFLFALLFKVRPEIKSLDMLVMVTVSLLRNTLFLTMTRLNSPVKIAAYFVMGTIIASVRMVRVSALLVWVGILSIFAIHSAASSQQSGTTQAASRPLRQRVLIGLILITGIIWAFTFLSLPLTMPHFSGDTAAGKVPTLMGGELESLLLKDPLEHPIAQLMDQAEASFEKRLEGQTKTLVDAIQEYRHRYKVNPPPNFDKWYQYARIHDYVLIDEFDITADDLRPFWSLSPETIRSRTRMALSNDANMFIGVYIRNGEVNVSGGGDDWLHIALERMIGKFSVHLPDMDLAINIHDEPRVVIPNEKLTKLVDEANTKHIPRAAEERNPVNKFSERPVELNKPIEKSTKTRFRKISYEPSWNDSKISCPPGSPAQQMDMADNKTAYALTDLEFVYNQTAFEDVCLTPSYEHTIAYFERPNIFNGVHELFPMFTQSKISSYQDILFPSPWYWYPKVSYDSSDDSPWNEKQESLYWRGSQTGGFSKDGSWKHSHRQLVVMKMNGLDEYTQKTPVDNRAILTRKGKSSGWQVAKTSLKDHAYRFDVRFSHIGQCDEKDCADQARFFSVGGMVPREDAFKHKFILDVDGNAFSGRFHAFLRSKSLVLKISVFREFSSGVNIVPWVHYIPLSYGGEDWIETLRYLSDEPDGQKRAQRMAEKQSEWADKALRRVDLEIWFFRLLLEYGRLVDDNRSTIGFSL